MKPLSVGFPGRAERRVDSAAGALEDYQSASDFAKERQAERFTRAVKRALEALEPLAGTGRDADLRARLDSLQTSFDTAAQATAATVGDEDAARARLEEWRESGELARDIEALEDMQALLADARRFDVGSGLFGRFGDPAALDAFVERVATWDETLAAFESLATKYESLGDRIYFRSAGAYAAIRDIQNRLPDTHAAMDRFKSEAPAAVDAALDEAEALARSAVAEERFGVFTGLNAPMRMALIAPDAMVRVYEALPITSRAEAQTLRASYQSRLHEIEQLKAQAAESIIASNTLPPTGYSGSDIDGVTTIARAGFEEVHGRQNIWKARIDSFALVTHAATKTGSHHAEKLL